MDDDASIQILEPDVDQQYIPERRTSKKPMSSAAATMAAAVAAAPITTVVKQSPPLLVVERKTTPSTIVNELQQREKEQEKEQKPETRIVNILEEDVKTEKTETKQWWEQQLHNIVWLLIKFFTMAVFAFLVLVVLNPPFVQDKTQFGLQKQSADLSRAALWSGIAGTAFLVVPAISNVVTSKFFPSDILSAIGVKRKKP